MACWSVRNERYVIQRAITANKDKATPANGVASLH